MSIRANGTIAACDGVGSEGPCPSTLQAPNAQLLDQEMQRQGWKAQTIGKKGTDNQQGFTFCPRCQPR